LAPTAIASEPVYVAPITVPGGNPVTAVPSETPRSPVMVVAPVFVTVVPARTPKDEAVPSPIAVGPAAWTIGATARTPMASETRMTAQKGNRAPRRRVRLVCAENRPVVGRETK
jgi:hypothetical protein